MNSFLFKQEHLVLCLAMVVTHCQCRFTTFPFYSTIISNPIQSNTYYLHAPHSGATYSLSNYFNNINVKEISTQKYFFYIFFNGKKNPSGLFCIKMKVLFLFCFFQICLKVDGYLFVIVIITYTIVTTIGRPAVFMASTYYSNKNFFHLRQKWVIFRFFLMCIFEYLIVLLVFLIWFMDIYKFLLFYCYTCIYELYQNIEALYIFRLYNSYKNISKIYNIGSKFCKKYTNSNFMYSNTSIESNNNILLTSKYAYILLYFLNFFCSSESLFIVVFLFFC